jgi:hypothetical protein
MEIGIRIPLFLKLADLYDAFGPLIQQAQNLVIDAIDRFPVLGKVSGHSYPPSSQPRRRAPVRRLEWHKLSGK